MLRLDLGGSGTVTECYVVIGTFANIVTQFKDLSRLVLCQPKYADHYPPIF